MRIFCMNKFTRLTAIFLFSELAIFSSVIIHTLLRNIYMLLVFPDVDVVQGEKSQFLNVQIMTTILYSNII